MQRQPEFRKITIYAIIIFFLCVGCTSAQSVKGTETLVSVHDPEISHFRPAVSGDYITWTDSNYRLHIYNTLTGDERIITNNTYSFEAPSIFGDNIVSQAYDSVHSNYDIFLYKISTNGETIITKNTVNSNETTPAISGHYIAYKSSDASGVCTVYLYDIKNPSTPPQVIASNTGSCKCIGFPTYCLDSSPPSLDGNYLAWDAISGNTYHIYFYDIRTGDPLNNTIIITPDSNATDDRYPVISGNYLIWQRTSGGYSDVLLYNISEENPINTTRNLTPNTPDSDQVYPSIDGDSITWYDYGTGGLSLYTISTQVAEEIVPANRLPFNAKISGNKIVYEGDWPPQIYLFTDGVVVTCPVANFTNTSPTAGSSTPFLVQFQDTSAPPANVSIWDFGDGSSLSRGTNPGHTYLSVGTYNVILTVSTPYCRNALTKTKFVSVGQKPIVNFQGTPTCGVMPLLVSFTDGSSGNPFAWVWEFGDNTTAADRIVTHTYISSGKYTVNLTTTNALGNTMLSKPGYISVLNRTQKSILTTIDGFSVTDGRNGQFISLNKSKISHYTLSGSLLSFNPPAEYGLWEVTLVSPQMFSDTGKTIEGNISGVILTSDQIYLEGLDEAVCPGCYFNFSLELSRYPPSGTIIPYIWEGAVPCDQNDLIKIVFDTGFTDLSKSAYEVQLATSNMGSINNMSLNFTVNSTWVTDRSKVWVVRIGDDKVGQVLPTKFAFDDTVHHLDVFSTYSPRGLSKFTLTQLSRAGNPLQLVLLFVETHIVAGSDGGAAPEPLCTWTKNGQKYTAYSIKDCPTTIPPTSPIPQAIVAPTLPTPTATPALTPILTTPTTIVETITPPITPVPKVQEPVTSITIFSKFILNIVKWVTNNIVTSAVIIAAVCIASFVMWKRRQVY